MNWFKKRFCTDGQKLGFFGHNIMYDEKISDLNNKLLEINWDAMLVNYSVTEQYTKFQDTLHNIIDKVAPYHTIKIPYNRIIKSPWISVGLHKCHKKQQQLYKKHLSVQVPRRIT